jgi:hypothetical protein
MTPDELRLEIAALLPWKGAGRIASLRTVERMPDSLLRETATKLASESALDTAHELRFLGGLMGSNGDGFTCEPFPLGPTCDAGLTLLGDAVGLEVAAHVAPAFSKAVTRVCHRLESWLEDRYSSETFKLEISNGLADFPLTNAGHLDEDALFDRLAEEATRKLTLLDANGAHDGFDLGEYISSCQRAGVIEVRQTGYSIPSSSVQGQLERIVKQKLSPPQWPSNAPGLLALILHSHPVPGSIGRYRIAEAAFAAEATLAGIIEVPCVLNARPELIARQPRALLSDAATARLRAALAFEY